VETARMLTHNVNHQVMRDKPAKPEKIDYDRIGRAIAKNSRGVSISIDRRFIQESVEQGLSKMNYFNNRYTFKR
jgi:hypothetical protein